MYYNNYKNIHELPIFYGILYMTDSLVIPKTTFLHMYLDIHTDFSCRYQKTASYRYQL